MDKIAIGTSRPYDVLVGRDLLGQAGELISQVLPKGKLCVVSDSHVRTLYAQELLISLSSAGFDPFLFEFPAGETSKNISTITNLVEYMARKGMSRTDAIISLGGGVTGDIAGFAAAIYMRGIKYVQIPTTLISCLDSSVGGKTGADLVAGKNLIGAFWQPSLVICDYSLFDTAPKESFADGMAEAIKEGAIYDASLFQYLSEIGPDIRQVILKCIAIKGKIVEDDERDLGVRKLLNFGHTVGHAIEKCSDYTISHGRAVAIGMAVVTRATYQKGICKEDFSRPIENLLRKYGLPSTTDISATEIANVAINDKKRDGDTIDLVILDAIGSAHMHRLPVIELRDFILAGL